MMIRCANHCLRPCNFKYFVGILLWWRMGIPWVGSSPHKVNPLDSKKLPFRYCDTHQHETQLGSSSELLNIDTDCVDFRMVNAAVN